MAQLSDQKDSLGVSADSGDAAAIEESRSPLGEVSLNESMGSPQCHICEKRSVLFDESLVLGKYNVRYFRCTSCGFVQTESPCWIEEAYSSAIAKQDTGILSRNLLNRRITTAVLNLLFPGAESALDYGAGHGIFVRLMRDSGFRFSWYDLHAANDYARGFEHKENEVYDLLTSFEVLEHLTYPLVELSNIMSLSPNVFVSTVLMPSPTPKISDWWYYGVNSGQHISFYTSESLHLIARKFRRHLLSHGPYHLFTTEPKSKFLFRLAFERRVSAVLRALRKRPSLMIQDFELLDR